MQCLPGWDESDMKVKREALGSMTMVMEGCRSNRGDRRHGAFTQGRRSSSSVTHASVTAETPLLRERRSQ